MNRGAKPDASSTPEPAAPTAAEPAASPDSGGSSTGDSVLYEPYPGTGFFHGGRNSPVIQAMARRLKQTGHWDTGQSAGPDWTNGHKRAFAAFQRTLRLEGSGDTSGIPDKAAWDRLRVPRTTPVPKKEG